RICGCDRNPLLSEQAIIIAENELVLRCVRLERIAVIERLRDGTAIAISKGDNSIALAKARHRESELAWEEIVRIKTLFGVTTDGLRFSSPGWKISQLNSAGGRLLPKNEMRLTRCARPCPTFRGSPATSDERGRTESERYASS